MYLTYANKVIPILKRIVKTAKIAKDQKIAERKQYLELINSLKRYESSVQSENVYKNLGKLVLARPDQAPLLKFVEFQEESIVTPFNELLVWVKQTQMEMKAYIEVHQRLLDFRSARKKAIEAKISAEKKSGGLQGKKGKEREFCALQEEVSSLYKEVENLTAIFNIAASYMSDIFLPLFKRRQLMLFYKIVQRLFQSDVSYLSNLNDFWTVLFKERNLSHF